ncbi:MAG: hypothetical protein AB1545_17235, partial [Thermodesulfobacteriota bacterium]
NPDATTDIVASSVSLTAANGIGNNADLDLQTQSLTAVTDNGNIDVNNDSGTAVTVHNLEVITGTGSIDYSQTGGGDAIITAVSTADGSIGLRVDSGRLDNSGGTITAGGTGDIVLETTTSGSVALGSVIATDNNVTINSAESINDDGVGAVDIDAATVALGAGSGIGSVHEINLAGTASLSADTTSGAVSLTNNATSEVTVSTLKTDSGSIKYEQTGNQSALFTFVNTRDGDITLTNTGGSGAGLIVGSVGADLVNDRVTLDAEGSITDFTAGGDNAVDISGAIINLTADSGGIGQGTNGSLEVNATERLNANTTADNSNITLTDVSGDLPIGLIDAGTGAVDLKGDTINDASPNPDAVTDIHASTVNLTAVGGIGNLADLDLSTRDLTAVSTTGGDIDINNASGTNVTAHNMSTGTGSINYNQTGGRSVSLVSVTSANGDITLSNTGGVNSNIFFGKIKADTTNGTVSMTADGSLLDALETESPNITAAHFKIKKAVNVGGAGNADINTEIQELTVASAAGVESLYLEDVDKGIHLKNVGTRDTLHITSRNGTLSANQVRANHIIFNADEIDFQGDSARIVGYDILLQPVSPGQHINVAGDNNKSDSLDLTSTDLAALKDGFAEISIGKKNGTGQIYIPYNQFRWKDPVTFHVPDGGIKTDDVSESVTKPYADDPDSYNILTGTGDASFTFLSKSPTTFELNGNIKTGWPNNTKNKIDKTLGGNVFIDPKITTILRPGDINVFSKVSNSIIAIDTDGGDISFGTMWGHSTYLMLLAGITETAVDGGTINGSVEVYGLRLSGSGGELGVKITSVDNVYSQDKWPAVYTIVTLPAPHYGHFTFNDLPVRGLPIDRDPQNAFLLGQMIFFGGKSAELFSIENYALPDVAEEGEGEENEDEASDTTPSEAGFGLTGSEKEAE